MTTSQVWVEIDALEALVQKSEILSGQGKESADFYRGASEALQWIVRKREISLSQEASSHA